MHAHQHRVQPKEQQVGAKHHHQQRGQEHPAISSHQSQGAPSRPAGSCSCSSGSSITSTPGSRQGAGRSAHAAGGCGHRHARTVHPGSAPAAPAPMFAQQRGRRMQALASMQAGGVVRTHLGNHGVEAVTGLLTSARSRPASRAGSTPHAGHAALHRCPGPFAKGAAGAASGVEHLYAKLAVFGQGRRPVISTMSRQAKRVMRLAATLPQRGHDQRPDEGEQQADRAAVGIQEGEEVGIIGALDADESRGVDDGQQRAQVKTRLHVRVPTQMNGRQRPAPASGSRAGWQHQEQVQAGEITDSKVQKKNRRSAVPGRPWPRRNCTTRPRELPRWRRRSSPGNPQATSDDDRQHRGGHRVQHQPRSKNGVRGQAPVRYTARQGVASSVRRACCKVQQSCHRSAIRSAGNRALITAARRAGRAWRQRAAGARSARAAQPSGRQRGWRQSLAAISRARRAQAALGELAGPGPPGRPAHHRAHR
uniref:Uncharacterized protein n=1 Tax=Ditylenchus dipsaci TaxID=166011 RepID=A0A915DUD3_9BILA